MLEVKPILPHHWPLLKDVRLRALADAPEAFGTTLDQAQAYSDAEWQTRAQRFSESPPAAGYLAFMEGVPCGMASAYPSAEDPQAAGLTAFWVAPEQRGQGIADALVRAIVERSVFQGAATLQAWVVEDNARALGFYRRLGFQDTTERQPHTPDPAKQIKLLTYALKPPTL